MTFRLSERPRPEREFPLRPVEVVSVIVALGVVITQAVRFAGVPEIWDWPSLVALAVGLVAADFVSGMLHWLAETWGSERTPWLGHRFIRPFRHHHAHPSEMVESHFFTTNGDTSLAAMPFLVAPFFLPLDTGWGRFVALSSWALGTWAMWTHQFHKWAHTKTPPRIVAWLQCRGVILNPESHRLHHKSPTANYCISTGWCNALLTRARFFPALEWVVTKLTGWPPRSEPWQTGPSRTG